MRSSNQRARLITACAVGALAAFVVAAGGAAPQDTQRRGDRRGFNFRDCDILVGEGSGAAAPRRRLRAGRGLIAVYYRAYGDAIRLYFVSDPPNLKVGQFGTQSPLPTGWASVVRLTGYPMAEGDPGDVAATFVRADVTRDLDEGPASYRDEVDLFMCELTSDRAQLRVEYRGYAVYLDLVVR